MVGCSHWLWACGKTVCYSEEYMIKQSIAFTNGRKQRKGRKDWRPTIPFQACPARSDCYWFSFKSSTASQQHQDEDQAFNTQAFGSQSCFPVAMLFLANVLRKMLNCILCFCGRA